MRNDIKITKDSIDNSLQLTAVLTDFRLRKELGHITEDEMWKEINSLIADDTNKFSALTSIDTIAETLAYYLGNEFYKEYSNFDNKYTEYLEYVAKSPTFSLDDEGLRLAVIKSAAKLHAMLKDKLISLRDK